MKREVPHFRIGLLLTEAGIIDPQELSKSIKVARTMGVPFLRVLLTSGALPESQLHAVVQAQSLLWQGSLDVDMAIKALHTVHTEDVSLDVALRQLGWAAKKSDDGLLEPVRPLSDDTLARVSREELEAAEEQGAISGPHPAYDAAASMSPSGTAKSSDAFPPFQLEPTGPSVGPAVGAAPSAPSTPQWTAPAPPNTAAVAPPPLSESMQGSLLKTVEGPREKTEGEKVVSSWLATAKAAELQEATAEAGNDPEADKEFPSPAVKLTSRFLRSSEEELRPVVDGDSLRVAEPPRDPLMMAALSGLCLPGIGQILLGQVAKGVVLLAVAVSAGIASGGVTNLLLWPMAAADAYLLADKLKRGKMVGPWDFF